MFRNIRLEKIIILWKIEIDPIYMGLNFYRNFYIIEI